MPETVTCIVTMHMRMIIRSLPVSVSFGALERLYIAQIRIMSVHTSEEPPLRAFTKFNTPQCPLSEARESMLPYQALTSLWLPATLECGVIDAPLHCFVFKIKTQISISDG